MKQTIQFPSSIQGIPCQIRAVWYPFHRGYFERGGLQISPDEPAGIEEYEVLDRDGRPAPWLERKIKDRDDDRIREDAQRYMGAHND